ncbi:hypothetical protein QQF64_001089 [Cirrhinus molitorella]|uniref:Uncharacterized protein n=1 Tax=Cirrhinus molitorella TaxID=172907 RepID=A0ABR3NZQ0_9TELE
MRRGLQGFTDPHSYDSSSPLPQSSGLKCTENGEVLVALLIILTIPVVPCPKTVASHLQSTEKFYMLTNLLDISSPLPQNSGQLCAEHGGVPIIH